MVFFSFSNQSLSCSCWKVLSTCLVTVNFCYSTRKKHLLLLNVLQPLLFSPPPPFSIFWGFSLCNSPQSFGLMGWKVQTAAWQGRRLLWTIILPPATVPCPCLVLQNARGFIAARAHAALESRRDCWGTWERPAELPRAHPFPCICPWDFCLVFQSSAKCSSSPAVHARGFVFPPTPQLFWILCKYWEYWSVGGWGLCGWWRILEEEVGLVASGYDFITNIWRCHFSLMDPLS